jgi:hypothetical protein
MHISISEAILSLGGNYEDFDRIVGNTYEGIDWSGDVKFSKEEVEAELQRLEEEAERNTYKELRAAEYPNFRDYLDGIVKGDQEQIQSYIDQCLAVKAKYPKPEN